MSAKAPERPAYWQSLEEWSRTPGFEETLEREFPDLPRELADPVGRRRFLTLMGASLGLAGATACTRQPVERIMPYVEQPETTVPGRPLYYASAMTIGGFARPVLVETHEGRPTKIEGNPQHPASLGATDAHTQASVLGLYDPGRSQTVTDFGDIRAYSAFVAAMRVAVLAQSASHGAGLRVLTGAVTSPTLARQLALWLEEWPEARWHVWEPLHRDHSLAGARLAFGRAVETLHRFAYADVILTLDADPFGAGPAHLRQAREFSRRRRPEGGNMTRLYAVESSASHAGSLADHRLPLRASESTRVAFALAAELGLLPATAATEIGEHRPWIAAVARDLAAHRGRGLVIAGEPQPAIVHALVHAINAKLLNVGSTVQYVEPVEAEPRSHTESLRELTRDMAAGRVELLLMLGGNPVYDAPSDLGFAGALERVGMRVHLSPYLDETSERCQWHVPESHYLEAWGDVRAFDGTVSIVQPVIAPLYGSRSAHEVLASLGESTRVEGYDQVREHWMAHGLDETTWRRALHRGLVPGTKAAALDVTIDAARVMSLAAEHAPAPSGPIEVVFRPDPTIYDGRFAANGWLQELPKPLSKLTWDNAALMNRATAARLGVGIEFSYRGGERGEAFADVVELAHDGRRVEAPVWIVPSEPDGSVTLHLGYGRTRTGGAGTGQGFDAYRLRTTSAPWSARVELTRTGRRMSLANTQGHWSLEGRDIVRSGSLDAYRRDPSLAPPHHHEPPETSMYPSVPYEGHAWGMAIDTSVCMGCSACVIACQAENNIPVIGKDQVAAGRAMHWLRIDRYHKGEPDHAQDLETYFQPMACQHCELAPCEPVCPVAATVHSAEGLNDMVYNRCVGTRYCSNNCPYKVRRFNYFLYSDWDTPSLKLLRNPDVTVRSRGVMEKCTYCVQRINAARIEAEIEGRPMRDGDVTTACEAACPTQAIRFGDLNDPKSRVTALHADPRSYGVLAELNTRPRTRYLGAVRNPNPTLRSADPRTEDGHEHGNG